MRRCSGLVTAIALSIVRDVGRSEDIAQEVFVAAWKDLSRLRNPRTFLPWLRSMTRHLSLQTLRDRHVPTEGAVLSRQRDERALADERLEAAERDQVLEEAGRHLLKREWSIQYRHLVELDERELAMAVGGRHPIDASPPDSRPMRDYPAEAVRGAAPPSRYARSGSR